MNFPWKQKCHDVLMYAFKHEGGEGSITRISYICLKGATVNLKYQCIYSRGKSELLISYSCTIN